MFKDLHFLIWGGGDPIGGSEGRIVCAIGGGVIRESFVLNTLPFLKWKINYQML